MQGKKPIVHPFEVGKTYASRNGEYEVVSVTESTMMVRNKDGGLTERNVKVSALIWENILAERQAPPPPEPTRRARARVSPTRRAKKPETS